MKVNLWNKVSVYGHSIYTFLRQFSNCATPKDRLWVKIVDSHFYPSFSDSEEHTDGLVPTYIHTHSNTSWQQASFVCYVHMIWSSGLQEHALFRDPAQVMINNCVKSAFLLNDYTPVSKTASVFSPIHPFKIVLTGSSYNKFTTPLLKNRGCFSC